MLLNVLMLVLGLVLLICGFKNKTKFFITAGIVLICLGSVSFIMDYKMGEGDFANSSVPFVLDKIVN